MSSCLVSRGSKRLMRLIVKIDGLLQESYNRWLETCQCARNLLGICVRVMSYRTVNSVNIFLVQRWSIVLCRGSKLGRIIPPGNISGVQGKLQPHIGRFKLLEYRSFSVFSWSNYNYRLAALDWCQIPYSGRRRTLHTLTHFSSVFPKYPSRTHPQPGLWTGVRRKRPGVSTQTLAPSTFSRGCAPGQYSL